MSYPIRRTATAVATVIYLSTAFALLVPSSALADDVLDDVVEEVEGVVEDPDAALDDTIDDTTEVVGDSVDDVTTVVADSIADTNDVVTTTTRDDVGDTTNAAVGQINQTSDQAGTDIQTGSGGGSNSASGPAGGGATAREDGGGSNERDREREGRPGDVDDWVWRPSDRLQLMHANTTVTAPAVVSAPINTDADPCRDDASLVCLGLLYGIGRYAKTFSTVLGVVATTGVGIIALMAIALAMGTTGSVALVASRDRSHAVARG